MSVPAWPVIGHEWAVDLLRRAVTGRRPSHAYLFAGPAQVGKTTLALAFAQALLCEKHTGTPCGECRTCRRIAQGRDPDVQIIAAEKNTIQIDQVRALQADAALSPLEGQYRLFILREIERATLPAANALLKTLEEPPGHVILILTCVRPDQVLPTIQSRCQVLPLRPLPLSQVQTALHEHWQVGAEQATLLARLSAGSLGWAVKAFTDQKLWEQRAQRLDDLAELADQNEFARLVYAEKLARTNEIAVQTLGLWASWWRDVLLVQQGLDTEVVNLDRLEALRRQAAQYESGQVQTAVTDVAATLRRLRANVNPRLALDVLLLRMPRLQQGWRPAQPAA